LSRLRSFIKGSIAVNSQKLLVAFLNFLITPIVLRTLGNEQYGMWILIGNIIGYLNLVDGGVSGTTIAFISRLSGKRNGNYEEQISILFSSIFFLQLGLGLIMLLVGTLLSFFVTDLFKLNLSSNFSTSIFFLFCVFQFSISFIFRPFAGLLKGVQKIGLNAIIEFVIYSINTISMMLFLHFGFGIISLPLGLLISYFIAIPIYFIVQIKTLPEVKLSFKFFSWKTVKDIYKVSSWWFFGVLSAMIIYSSDNLVIGRIMGPGKITAYALTIQLSVLLRDRLYVFNNSALPAIGQLFGENNFVRLRELYLKVQPLVWSVAAISFGFVILFNRDFMSIWVGSEYFLGNKINLLVSSYLFITLIFHSSSILISASLEVKEISKVRFLEAFFNIVLTIFFTNYFGYYGLIGSTLLVGILTSFWYAPYKICTMFQISIFEYLKTIYLKSRFSLLMFMVLPLFIILLFPNASLVFKVIYFIPSFIFVLWSSILSKGQKQQIFKILKIDS
jgi:O-antigen/teichoic acid export membrane protein